MTSSQLTIKDPAAAADDFGVLRALLDLALQPIDRFDGFDHRDQVGTAALRYQLNFIAYALAMYQSTRTPAFTGYLAAAQRNLIVKMCDKRVWGYWARESRLGYLRRETDPIRHANVMYSGYFGVMLGFYETLTADNHFNQPGSLPLRWSEDVVHEYRFNTLADAIRVNMLANPRSPQYPCEPHLIYPICNTFAINTLLMYDRLHAGTTSQGLIDSVRRSYDKDGWRRNGRFVSMRLGSSINLSPPVIGSDAAMALWLHAVMPDIASETWEVIRHRLISVTQDTVTLRGRSWLRFDAGNYRLAHGEVNTLVAVMNAAIEFGDTTVAQAVGRSIEQELDTEWAHGARRYRGVSNLANAMYALARFSLPNSMASLLSGDIPRSDQLSPRLTEASYPDVLVARAVSDGSDLELILHPGVRPHRVTVRIDQLRPLGIYHCHGGLRDSVSADARGTACIEVDLTTTTYVSLKPSS